MTASQAVGVLLCAATLSGLFALVYWLLVKLNVRHPLRLMFLKANIALVWLSILATVTMMISGVDRAMGSLLPANVIVDQAVSSSKARVLMFEGDHASVSHFILGLYALGFSLMLLRLIFSYAQLRKIVLNSSAENIAGRAMRRIDVVTSPFSFGFFSPQIFVPCVFLDNRSREEIDVMLTHEETHILNRDPQWKLVSHLTRVFLYFAPTASYLHRHLDLEMEVECDRLTMSKSQMSARQYGNLLIDTMVNLQKTPANSMCAYMSNTNLRKRIQAMTAKTFHRPILTAFFAALIVAASVTAVATASGIAKLKGQYHVKADLIVDGKVVSSPQFIVLPSEPATLEMKSEHPESALKMTLTAADFSSAEIEDGIDLKMAIDYKSQSRNFRAHPRVVVAPGEEGTVIIGTGPNDTLEMRIKAIRQ